MFIFVIYSHFLFTILYTDSLTNSLHTLLHILAQPHTILYTISHIFFSHNFYIEPDFFRFISNQKIIKIVVIFFMIF